MKKRLRKLIIPEKSIKIIKHEASTGLQDLRSQSDVSAVKLIASAAANVYKCSVKMGFLTMQMSDSYYA